MTSGNGIKLKVSDLCYTWTDKFGRYDKFCGVITDIAEYDCNIELQNGVRFNCPIIEVHFDILNPNNRKLSETELYDSFCSAADLNKKTDLYLKKHEEVRKDFNDRIVKYGWFTISHSSRDSAWWNPYIGISFLGIFMQNRGYPNSVTVTRSIRNKYTQIGRQILLDDLILL